MEKEEKPVPTEARQRTGGPSAGQVALTVSEEMPLRVGPRHCGQAAAAARWPKDNVTAERSSRPNFIGRFLAEGPWKSIAAEDLFVSSSYDFGCDSASLRT